MKKNKKIERNIKFSVWRNPWHKDEYGQVKWPVDDEPFDPFDVDTSAIQELLNQYDTSEEMISAPPIKTIFSQNGIMPLIDHSMPEKVFKMWYGHTTFRVYPKELQIIDETEGVEALRQLTPYRIELGIAQLFSDREVMLRIKQRLIDE